MAGLFEGATVKLRPELRDAASHVKMGDRTFQMEGRARVRAQGGKGVVSSSEWIKISVCGPGR